jgi:hypothetical protein
MPGKRKGRKRWRRPKLVIAQILAWADDYHRETGRWPKRSSGPIAGELEETWGRVNNALILGLRSLPGGSSLAQLLARYRGVRNVRGLPILTEKVILRWAQDHHRRTGAWPHENSGPVDGAPGEVWKNIDAALRQGTRSLRAGSSLARLLAARLGVRNPACTPPLTVEQILAGRCPSRTDRAMAQDRIRADC